MKFVCFCALLLIFSNLCEAAVKGSAAQRGKRVEEGDCKCPRKHKKPIDCAEVLENGNTRSGMYTIWPRSRLSDGSWIAVYLVTDGGGWTVIQRRCQYGNGEDYFVKNWNEYKNGFVKIKKEFWLGNDNIHSLTNQGHYSARFDMRNESQTSVFAVYENFWIGNEESKYRIHLSEYSGTAVVSIRTFGIFVCKKLRGKYVIVQRERDGQPFEESSSKFDAEL
ncbi:unnamed protein product [Larinioides sclopetarius]|uniref:Fibrinogen C-terminal domain-containing protein n=1 Tax=Larinioides sclopetarius TaxID=280406 RepID=A0AAV2AJU5_9ARAC